jgi:outer membrane protein assembly factor BamA
VLALRGDLAADLGARSPGFDVGGANGGSLPIALEVDVFGRGLSFPVRGYPEAAQSGNRALTGSAEYRFPVARVERGVGLLPLYLDRLTGDLFADAGTAWCAGVCPRIGAASPDPHPLVSFGAELLAEFRLGYHTPVPLRLGVAMPLREGGGPEVYLRLGRAF